jgi:hypothetical protein
MKWMHRPRPYLGLALLGLLLARAGEAQPPVQKETTQPNPYTVPSNPYPGALPAPLRRADDPPLADIWIGKALNERLATIQDLQKRQIVGPRIELEPTVLKQINFLRGTSLDSIALLKKEGRLDWPKTLKGGEYKAEQERLHSLIGAAMTQARKGKVEARLLEGMTQAQEKLKEKLNEQVADVPPSQYIEARRFLNSLDNLLAALRQGDVGDFIKVAEEARRRGKTVEDLVRFMTEKNLRFGPALPGEETAYQHLHHALTTVAKQEKPQPKK